MRGCRVRICGCLVIYKIMPPDIELIDVARLKVVAAYHGDKLSVRERQQVAAT